MKYNNKPIDLSLKTLRMAVKKQDVLGVKRLITRENLNKKVGCTANTILHSLAARKGKKILEIARIISANGENSDIKDKHGNTPRDIAVQKNNSQMAALLSNESTLYSDQAAVGLASSGLNFRLVSFFKENKLSNIIPAENIEVEIDPSFVEGVKNFTF